MYQVRGHEMRENQARMISSGPFSGGVEGLDSVLSFRSGITCYSSRKKQQTFLSKNRDPKLETQITDLQAQALAHLARFAGKDSRLDLHMLIRNRRVAGVADYHQRFHGFWGNLSITGQWPCFFGSGPDGEVVFRRGVWEEWDRNLAPLKRVNDNLPLIMSPYCATVFHEAVGHAVEADYLVDSTLRYHVGRQVSHQDLHMMDRPDLAGFAGSMSHDDTGAAATATTLIHRGVLVGDLDMGRGVMRRASYREPVQVRATNFLINKGLDNPDSWLADLPECYYLAWVRSGNWKPKTGKIKILTGPIFHLKKGRPIAFADWYSLAFSTGDLLARIDGVGHDLCMDPVIHWCRKKHQSVPISLGGPSLLLKGGAL